MNGPRPVTAGVAAAALLSLALAGCVVLPSGRYYGGGGGPVVTVAPPPPLAEYPGVAPALGLLWLAGFWEWRGGRHVWNAGRWEAPPQGQRWAPHAWVQEGGGWRQRGGRWERR